MQNVFHAGLRCHCGALRAVLWHVISSDCVAFRVAGLVCVARVCVCVQAMDLITVEDSASLSNFKDLKCWGLDWTEHFFVA